MPTFDARLAAWRGHRQGLDGSLAGATIEDVLQRSGWIRSVGGANPYSTLFARVGASREQVDQAVLGRRIHELPAVRGCTYVLPAVDYADGLVAGWSFGEVKKLSTVSVGLGIGEDEIRRLEAAVLKALASGPSAPNQLKDALGTHVRSLGEAGKKKGVSTTLPIALGRLQAKGQIRRLPIGGRLDQQRYQYARWEDGPLGSEDADESLALARVAKRFFAWLGPATEKQCATFLGISVKRFGELPLSAPLVATEHGLIRAEDEDAFDRFEVADSHPRFISSLDTLLLGRRMVEDLVADRHRDYAVSSERTSGSLGGLAELPHHAIVDRGELIGLWEFDGEKSELVWRTFDKASPLVEEQAHAFEAFVKRDLGDFRSFSLDSPSSRASTIDRLRSYQWA